MKKGQILEGTIERVEFPNKGDHPGWRTDRRW